MPLEIALIGACVASLLAARVLRRYRCPDVGVWVCEGMSVAFAAVLFVVLWLSSGDLIWLM